MTINVVCRRDAINRNRLAPLALVFTHDRRRKFVGLGISEALVHWDFDKQQPTADCPDRAEIQFQITSKIREYERKIKKLEVLEIPVTFDTLFEQNGKRINCTVGEYFKQIIERLEKVEKYSSASKHKVTLVLVSQFRSVNMRFDELDLTYLREFEIFLSQKGNVTTVAIMQHSNTAGCILLKFYIKPQHTANVYNLLYVVSYRNSTSNHNTLRRFLPAIRVVSYRNSTSNHNIWTDKTDQEMLYLIEILHQTTTANVYNLLYIPLYLIEILHQTTTGPRSAFAPALLYLIEILHQTTTDDDHARRVYALYLIEILHQTTTCSYQLRKWTSCILSKFYIKPQPRNDQPAFTQRCILSKFYIKPQHRERRGYADRVVSYRNSTSNHNSRSVLPIKPPVVSYRNSTSNHNRGFCHRADHEVVSYRNSTSNHNIVHTMGRNTALYLIEILHQTTTPRAERWSLVRLYLIEILHQTTTPTTST